MLCKSLRRFFDGTSDYQQRFNPNKHRLEINAIDLQNAFPKTSFQIKVRTHFSLETLFNVFLDCVRTTQRLINELETVANFEIDKLTP